VALGIVAALKEIKPHVPIVVRMAGTNAGEALKILENAHLETADTLLGAVQKAVAFSNGGWNGYLD
jgi:succinyl-CoA synthetase beta subunit